MSGGSFPTSRFGISWVSLLILLSLGPYLRFNFSDSEQAIHLPDKLHRKPGLTCAGAVQMHSAAQPCSHRKVLRQRNNVDVTIQAA
jgi:hypothetical protein